MAWSAEFSDQARRQLKKLDGATRRTIMAYIEKRVLPNPEALGKPLRYDLAGRWRYRVGDWRIICRLNRGVLRVLVLDVEHRSKVYD